MQNQSKTTVFIFFSESQAIAFSEAARTLLTWAGTCCMTTQHAQPTRTLWSDCVRILSQRMNDMPE
ncbi:hypothetical protein [Parasutterella muris]|uniref:hypothetical protein n=1 Tax=Parasutterella muris TaxID=2565572 RepID=UPI00203D33CE|nr:hypothetical protein [Parasutterella muris]